MGGPWYDEARVIRAAGYLTGGTSFYQESVLAGMFIFEEAQEVDRSNWLFETLFAFMQPEQFNKWKKKKDFIRNEEGVDEVIYKGEDDWDDILEDFGALGMTNIDAFGEGLNK